MNTSVEWLTLLLTTYILIRINFTSCSFVLSDGLSVLENIHGECVITEWLEINGCMNTSVCELYNLFP